MNLPRCIVTAFGLGLVGVTGYAQLAPGQARAHLEQWNLTLTSTTLIIDGEKVPSGTTLIVPAPKPKVMTLDWRVGLANLTLNYDLQFPDHPEIPTTTFLFNGVATLTQSPVIDPATGLLEGPFTPTIMFTPASAIPPQQNQFVPSEIDLTIPFPEDIPWSSTAGGFQFTSFPDFQGTIKFEGEINGEHTSGTSSVTFSAVPEPSSYGLIGILVICGATAHAFVRRRRLRALAA